MARGSGKRSRLHRGFSKGPSSVPSLRQSLRRWLGVLGLCRQQLGRAIAWLRCALCRVSKVKAAHVQHLPPIALQATDGRHAAGDSRKPASASAFGRLSCCRAIRASGVLATVARPVSTCAAGRQSLSAVRRRIIRRSPNRQVRFSRGRATHRAGLVGPFPARPRMLKAARPRRGSCLLQPSAPAEVVIGQIQVCRARLQEREGHFLQARPP
jgi:hypothetical protein